jgi:hypothetical protein
LAAFLKCYLVKPTDRGALAMKGTGLGYFKAVAFIAALLIGGGAGTVQAGETSTYFKSGWFTWDESLNGSSFVKEKGMMYAAGVARKDDVSFVSIAELVEVWGGNLDYDGHDVTGAVPIKSDTIYLGTREELALSVKLPVAGDFSLAPFAGVGHKFWVRTRSSEDWNSFYARGGVAGKVKVAGITMFAKGGALIPVYTRTHVSLSDAGYTDVVTEPKMRVSGFAEGGVTLGAFAVSVEYEAMEFGQSERVATRRVSAAKGVTIGGSEAFQPNSSSTSVSLKIAYSF